MSKPTEQRIGDVKNELQILYTCCLAAALAMETDRGNVVIGESLLLQQARVEKACECALCNDK